MAKYMVIEIVVNTTKGNLTITGGNLVTENYKVLGIAKMPDDSLVLIVKIQVHGVRNVCLAIEALRAGEEGTLPKPEYVGTIDWRGSLHHVFYQENGRFL